MNIVDIGILAVIAASVLFGLYRGFISSVGHTGGALIAFVASFWLCPTVAGFVRGNATVREWLETYTEKIVGSNRTVSQLNLPQPLTDFVSRVAGNGTEAVNSALVNALISILSFVVCFILLYVLFSLLMSAVRAVFRLPVLKQADTLAGGIFGLLRGVVFLFVLFTLVPVAQALVPGDTVAELMNGSSLAGIFDSGALINAILRGSLFG